MRIKEILKQHRRDFDAVYECEHCGDERTGGGYDDRRYHHDIIPSFKCSECGKKARDDYVPRETKYPDGFQI